MTALFMIIYRYWVQETVSSNFEGRWTT